MILGHPGLRLLARRKLAGTLRKQRRRLRSVSGVLFAIVGLGLFAVWITSVVAGSMLSSDTALPAQASARAVRLAGFFFTLLSLISALGHRGLYLPKEEIELLFSAPVSRGDLIRYRLLVNFGRNAPAGIVLGLLVMWRMPQPLCAFLGTFLAVQTLPVASQMVSILAGGAENRLLERLPRGGLRVVHVLAAVALWVFAMGFLLGPDALNLPFDVLRGRALGHPALDWISAPFEPWARTIVAPTLAAFLPWFALCLVVFGVLVELTARIPVDFRELSLQTSADVARRLSRLRRGGVGAGAVDVRRGRLGWRVPWLWGRGPFGALAWRKTAGIVRKARGALFVAAAIVVFVTVLAGLYDPGDDPDAALAIPVMLAFVGTIYFSAGLRFDFRDDLDHLELVKSWPLSAPRAFLATILPQAALIAALVLLSIAGRALIARQADPRLLLAFPVVPLLTLTWAALDNAVFLYAPVRYLPGQEGALQHIGRSMVMMLVRMIVIVVVLGAVGLVASLPLLAGLHGAAALGLGAVLGLAVLAAIDVALVWLGGRMLRRFDLARDTG